MGAVPGRDALRLDVGEPLSAVEAFRPPQEDCDCKEGMFPKASRRQFLSGTGALAAGAAAAAGLVATPARAEAPPGAAEWPLVTPSWSAPGRDPGEDGGYGLRSQFETEVRAWSGTSSRTPLEKSQGIVTPSGLHFERHHAGIPTSTRRASADHPRHGRPPDANTRRRSRALPLDVAHMFIECSGNSGGVRSSAAIPNVQRTHGLTSTSEWTGVPLSTLLRRSASGTAPPGSSPRARTARR